jgi:hypothetical protein
MFVRLNWKLMLMMRRKLGRKVVVSIQKGGKSVYTKHDLSPLTKHYRALHCITIEDQLNKSTRTSSHQFYSRCGVGRDQMQGVGNMVLFWLKAISCLLKCALVRCQDSHNASS